jgi:hypothetical protein
MSVKYPFVNRTIQLFSQLPSGALGTISCKPSNFEKRLKESDKLGEVKVVVKYEFRRLGNSL